MSEKEELDPKYSKAVELIDRANRKDPNREIEEGESHPAEYLYSVRMSRQLEEFLPDASDALRLAVRCQHIERWVLPRKEYPMTRVGYIKWRNELKRYHSQRAAEILDRAGYDRETTQRVADLVQKKGLRTDVEAQALEDVICLVFLRYYFEDFSQKHEKEKVLDILRKTWKKMSEKGHEAALNLPLPHPSQRLIEEALS